MAKYFSFTVNLVRLLCIVVLLPQEFATVNSLCTDLCHKADHRCPPENFPCFRDCCTREEDYCDTSKREQRCVSCRKKTFLCDTNKMPVECLLYCFKQKNPANVTDSDISCFINRNTVIGVGGSCILLTVGMACFVVFTCWYKPFCKKLKKIFNRKDSKGNTAGMIKPDDKDVHKNLLSNENRKDSDSNLDTDELKVVTSDTDSRELPNEDAPTSTTTNPPADGDTPPSETRTSTPATSENSVPSSPESNVPSRPSNVQPTDTANATQPLYIHGTNGGSPSMLHAMDVATPRPLAPTTNQMNSIVPSDQDVTDPTNPRLAIATSPDPTYKSYTAV